MQFLRTHLFPVLLKHLAALAVTGLTTILLLPLRDVLGTQVIALVYLFPVLLATFLWSLFPGVLAALTSFLVFNYFFLPPYRTLTVHQSQDLVALIVFLIIAVITNQLIGRAREGMRLAKQREWEATRLYELILALARTQDYASVARTLAEHLFETLPCYKVEVAIQPATGEDTCFITEPAGNPQGALTNTRYPILTARGQEGEIRFWVDQRVVSEENERLLYTYASQGALSVERIHLFESERKGKILEEADRAKSSLLSSVSHELRSPLAAMKASVSSLRSGVVEWDSPARHELLSTIEEEADHLNFLVGNLLDMSRIETGALQPQMRWNSLYELVTGVLSRMGSQLKDYQIALDIPSDMPLLPTDYFLMDRVFSNLLNNSVKFAPRGTSIAIRAKVEGEVAHIQVTNQSPPVPPENLERIFEKFNRVGGRDGITGTGLGLSICKGIIEAHQGKLWAQNTVDGFAFHFLLPTSLDGKTPLFPSETVNE